MAGFRSDKVLLGIFVLLTVQHHACQSKMFEDNVKILSFNLRMFGDAKMRNQGVVDILTEIIRRYDITIIQEIRDKDGSAFDDLMIAINSDGEDYNSVLSSRLGRTSSKEEYGVIYRKRTVQVDGIYQYPDPHYEYFERPPFAVKVLLKTADNLADFAIIDVHTKPTDAVEEIDKLTDVYQKTMAHWGGLQNVLIAGDFNAGCSYVTPTEMKKISLRKDSHFSWFIGDDVDTTTSNSDCAYDRFVAAGDQLKAAIVPGSARVFRFDEVFDLSVKEMKAVSDHYPIELQIRGRVDRTELAKFDRDLSTSFQDSTDHTRSDVMGMFSEDGDLENLGFDVSIDINSNYKKFIMALKEDMTKLEVETAIDSIDSSNPIFRESVRELIKLDLASPFMSGLPNGQGFLAPYDLKYSFTVWCEYDSPYKCSFKLTRRINNTDLFT